MILNLPAPDVEGFVLAGGRSSRFGSDKARARYGSRTLLGHALRAVRGLGLTPRMVARDVTPGLGVSLAFVVGEALDRGPVEGLRASLLACSAVWALVLAVDMPLVDARLLRLLLAARGDVSAGAPPVVCFEAQGRRHPFPGLYHRSLRDVLAGAPPRSMLDLQARVGVRALGEREAGRPDLAQCLRNVNVPGDTEMAPRGPGGRGR